MSEAAAAPPAPIAANLRWFAGAYAALLFFGGALFTVIAVLGLQLPLLSAAGALFAGATLGAGSRFRQRGGAWDKAVRRSLALGYVVIAYVVSILVFTAQSLLAHAYLVTSYPSREHDIGTLLLGGALGGLFMAPVCYVIARLLLHFGVRAGKQS